MIHQSNTSEYAAVRQDYSKRYSGNYLGIVIQNNDPEKQGKVKVYVPHITPTVYDGWTELQEDKQFKFIGENLESDLTNVIDKLKSSLPWAECASPLVGSQGIGLYNAKNKHGSISDANVYINREESSNIALNADGIGEKDAFLFDTFPVNDAFNQALSGEDGVRLGTPNNINKNSYTYRPNSHSNQAKGSFSIPNVGSHVWVFFKEGDPLKPVYFAAAFSALDWKDIYDSSDDKHGPDYPGSYENKSSEDGDHYGPDTETYRNKFTLNQKGGTFEIISTDNRETVRLSQYHGSYMEMNPQTMSIFSANNFQKQILGNSFETIRGTRNIWVAGDSDQLIRGDSYIKVGTFSKQAFYDWKTLVNEIANTKQLFELQRVEFADPTFSEFIQKISPAQVKDKGSTNDSTSKHAPCPLCSSSSREEYWKIQYSLGAVGLADINSSTDNAWSSVNPYQTATEASLTQPAVNPANFLGSGPCPVCNGTGKSPSSQDGTFNSSGKDTLIEDQYSDLVKQLTDLEAQMGLGGSEIRMITKHKVETIGLLFNDFPSIRVDPVGRITKSGVHVLDGGVVNTQQAYPLVESVHVDDLPGGSYSLNICNRFNCLVGAGGVSLKSMGVVEIGGTVTNITGEDVNISAAASLNLTSQNRINIAADLITLRNKNYSQVLVDSNLGVAQNVVIGGSMHVEGELSVQHITAPAEIQETEQVRLYGRGVPGKVIGYVRHVTSGGAIEMLPCYGNGEEDSIVTYPHSHTFKNIPLTLTNSADDTRRVGKQCNERYKVGPAPVVNEMKGLQSSGSAHVTDIGTMIS